MVSAAGGRRPTILDSIIQVKARKLDFPDHKCPEPSGITFHPGRGTIFIVDDGGELVELERDGGVRHHRIGHQLDAEGLTIGPGGQLFLSTEGTPPTIIKVDPEGGNIVRGWRVDQEFAGVKLIGDDPTHGLEGLCFIPSEQLFVAINQSDPAVLVELDLGRPGATAGVVRVTKIICNLEPIVQERASDLAYDGKSGHVLLAESSHHEGEGRLYELSRQGELLGSIRLPGKCQEGVTVDDERNIYIAQDSGGAYRIDAVSGH